MWLLDNFWRIFGNLWKDFKKCIYYQYNNRVMSSWYGISVLSISHLLAVLTCELFLVYSCPCIILSLINYFIILQDLQWCIILPRWVVYNPITSHYFLISGNRVPGLYITAGSWGSSPASLPGFYFHCFWWVKICRGDDVYQVPRPSTFLETPAT